MIILSPQINSNTPLPALVSLVPLRGQERSDPLVPVALQSGMSPGQGHPHKQNGRQPRGSRGRGRPPPWPGEEGQGLTTAGVRVLGLGLPHLLRERGPGGVEAHLRVLWGLRAAGRALRGVQVEGRVALAAAAAGGACQGPAGGGNEVQQLQQTGGPPGPTPGPTFFPAGQGRDSLTGCEETYWGVIPFLPEANPSAHPGPTPPMCSALRAAEEHRRCVPRSDPGTRR